MPVPIIKKKNIYTIAPKNPQHETFVNKTNALGEVS